MTFSSKQASKNAKPEWILPGRLDTARLEKVEECNTVNPNIESSLGGDDLKPHLVQTACKELMSRAIPFNNKVTFLDEMLLESLHLLLDEVGLKKRDRSILQDMRCPAI
jgi:hypothetical protein